MIPLVISTRAVPRRSNPSRSNCPSLGISVMNLSISWNTGASVDIVISTVLSWNFFTSEPILEILFTKVIKPDGSRLAFEVLVKRLEILPTTSIDASTSLLYPLIPPTFSANAFSAAPNAGRLPFL